MKILKDEMTPSDEYLYHEMNSLAMCQTDTARKRVLMRVFSNGWDAGAFFETDDNKQKPA